MNRLNPYVEYGAIRLLAAALAALVIPLVSRLLESADYGRYAMAFSSAALTGTFGVQWICVSIIRFVPGLAVPEGQIRFAITRIWLWTAPGVAVVGALGASFFVDTGTALIAALLAVLESRYQLHVHMARALDDSAGYRKLLLSRGLLTLLLLAGLVPTSPSPFGVLAAMALAVAAALLFNSRISPEPRDCHGSVARVWRLPYRSWLGFGLPLSLGYGFTLVVAYADRMMLFFLASPSSAGIYSAHYDLVTQVIAVAGVTVSTAGQPAVIRETNRGKQRTTAKALFESYNHLLAISLLSAGVAVVAVWPVAEKLVLGTDLRLQAGQRLVALLVVAAAITAVVDHYINFRYRLAMRTTPVAVWTIMGGAANICANALLIPRYGMMGAAVATLLSYSIMAVGPIVHLRWIGAPSGRGKVHVAALGLLGLLSMAAVDGAGIAGLAAGACAGAGGIALADRTIRRWVLRTLLGRTG